MTAQVSVRSNLRVVGALALDQNNVDFPVGKLGSLCVKGSNLYAYVLFNGMETWYPLVRNISKTYSHTQSTPSMVWVIPTGFNNRNYWFQVKNAVGEIEYPAKVEDVDDSTVKLTFSEAISGTAFFVGVNDLDVSEVKASLIRVGSNVVITDADITINGVSVLASNVTSAQVDAKINTAISTEVIARDAAIATATAGMANPSGSVGTDFSTKNLTVAGDLVVNGDTVTVNSTTVTTKDNLLTLNSGEPGAGVTKGYAGLEIDRGILPKYMIEFDESDDLFKVGQAGNLETIASRPYVIAQVAAEAAARNAAIAAGDVVSTKAFNGAVTCNYTTEGSYVVATVTGVTALTIVGVPNDGRAYGMTFELTNAGANITWPASVTWLGIVPTLRTSGISVVTLVTRNGGTSWLGSAA